MSKKTTKSDTCGRDRDTGKLNGSPKKRLMFPVTCKDGGKPHLFQCRYQPGEKQVLEMIAEKRDCDMSELFIMNGEPFLNQEIDALKRKARLTHASLASWVAENIIAPLVKKGK